MTDDRVLDYLRSRGQAEVPPNLVASVMTALDEPVPGRSPFAAYLPALAAAGAVAVIALVAFLAGPGRDMGPSPTSTPTSSPSVEPTIDDLGVALLDAVHALHAAPGVEGRQQVEIDGVIGAVTWFDWRPNGDQVVVQRQDLDVTETGWWMVPDGAPSATGERIHTGIRVAIGDELFVTGEAGGWEVLPREFGFPTGAFGTAILDGAVLPWRPLDALVSSLEDPSDARVQRDDLPDGGVEWRLEYQWMGSPLVQRWTIGSGGELRSWIFERRDRTVDPEGDFDANATDGWLEYTITDGDPIEPPDVDADPDPADFGYPADMPLEPAGEASAIDYRAYVEDALDALEAYHWNSANIDWAAARSAALDDLPDDPTADQVHARIRSAIATFDPFNTVFVRPTDVPSDGTADGPSRGNLPSGDRLGALGIIVLASPDGSDLTEYLDAARAEMAAAESDAPACGWVVDLRDYAAGGWGPPIWSMGGLLGEGPAVTFDSAAAPWAIAIEADGRATVDGIDWPPAVDSPFIDLSFIVRSADDVDASEQEPPYLPLTANPPIAVLIGPGTASGGEQAVVSFLGRPDSRVIGGATAGQPIVAPNLSMVDGAVLRVPIWVPVDRSGVRYTTNITPDDVVGDTRPLGSDAVLDAAVAWLETQPGCS